MFVPKYRDNPRRRWVDHRAAATRKASLREAGTDCGSARNEPNVYPSRTPTNECGSDRQAADKPDGRMGVRL